MVMPLARPQFSTAQLIDQIVAERQKGVNAALFATHAAEWKTRVQQYEQKSGAPADVPQWPVAVANKTPFLNLYSHPLPNSVQAPILQKLRAHGLNLCPACGELGEPNSLDHYLPKQKYPQFAVLPLNLFPMCDACQRAKDEKTTDSIAKQFFIHPYFHTFSQAQIFELTISAPMEAPTFELCPAAMLTVAEKALVETHLRELDMHYRYAKFFRTAFRKLLRNANRMRDTGQDVEATLTTFRFDAEHPSPNGWDHVFYAGVLSSVPFMRFLKTGALGAFL